MERPIKHKEDTMFKCKNHPTYKGVYPPKVDCRECRVKYTEQHYETKGSKGLSEVLGVSDKTIRNYRRELGIAPLINGVSPDKPINEQVNEDRMLRKARDEKNITAKKYRLLQSENEMLERKMEAVLEMANHKGSLAQLKLTKKNGRGEGVANVLLSDYHLEERVLANEVEGLNEYNLDISKIRLEEFFKTTLRLVEIEQHSTDVHKLVIWMLGDNVTGWLHEESIHSTLLPPVSAAIEARLRLRQGIQYILDNSELTLTIPCVVGNHGRITRKPNHATENGNSLEYMLYHFLANDFAGNDRVQFLIPESGFAFVDEFGFVIRGHHGHRIRYQGGTLGIGVPASKKIAQWNKTRHADLDVFGHHHTAQDGENFIANGSVIGFNSYAYKGGFSFQRPEQKFFVVHSKWGRVNLSRSIFFSV